ncbi:MAG: ComEC/Rec2 family competence protein [Clostridiales bacterium]|nr:ComEC/Rec2 family competence protein [Clostridiales bacterium]
MTKPINFRPILFCALSLIFGMALFVYHQRLGVWTVLIPTILAITIYIIFLLIVEKDKRFTLLMSVVFCLLFAFMGMFSFGIYTKRIENRQVESGNYTVVGEVYKVSFSHGRYVVNLKNCTYDGKDGGNLYVNTFYSEIELYDRLELDCRVSPYSRVENGAISTAVKSGREMYAENVYSYKILGKTNSLASKFKQVTDKLFFDVLGKNGGILSALIRGDTAKMGEIVDPFRLVGIAHIFAVSGMHVGLLFAALSYIFKKIPAYRWLKTLLICSALFFYSYLCGFTASSLRASIMCSCMAISRRLGEKHDGINAIAEAFIIIALLSPIQIFSVGFILSFTVSFSLMVLSPPIIRFFEFLPKPFAESIGVLVSAQLSAIPLTVTYFGYFSLISFLANFILLPVVTIIFYLTVIGMVLCLILPINQLIALFIPKILILGAQGLTNALTYVLLPIEYFPKALKWVYYPCLIAVTDLLNLPKWVKTVFFSIAMAILVVVILVSNLA